MPWVVGEKRRLRATFTPDAASGEPTEPVKVNAVNPDGTTAIDDQTATKDTEKSTTEKTVYYYDHEAKVAGKYLHYSFRSADGAVETEKRKIIVDESKP